MQTGTSTFSPVVVRSSQHHHHQHQQSQLASADAKQLKNDFNLGRLDGLVSSPNRSSKVRVADSNKIAAILLETNIVELQRHLLTITVQNQVSTLHNKRPNQLEESNGNRFQIKIMIISAVKKFLRLIPVILSIFHTNSAAKLPGV